MAAAEVERPHECVRPRQMHDHVQVAVVDQYLDFSSLQNLQFWKYREQKYDSDQTFLVLKV